MATPQLTITDVFTPATQQQWLATLLGNATTLQLPVSSWQSGGVARAIVAMMSYGFSSEDGLISMAAQGGFLDFAATGTVTITNPITGVTTTVPVTPDPSIPAQWPAPNTPPLPGWLDILADGSYNCQRFQQSFAIGTEALTNTANISYGPFSPGTYHIQNPATGATYSNTASLTIAAANIVGGTISAATNANPIVLTTTAAHGLSAGATVTVTGVTGNTAANGTWIVSSVPSSTQLTLAGSIGNGAYTSSNGTVNVCTTATFQADVAGTGSTSGAGTITQPVSSLNGVSCFNTGSLVGNNFESNIQLAARCRLKLQSISNGGPAGAYAFFALSSSATNPVTGVNLYLPPGVSLTGGVINRALVQPLNGVVTTTIANASNSANPNVAGVANIPVSNAASHGGLIQLTVSTTTNMSTGMIATVSGILGTVPANGTWTITVIDGSHIDLQGSTFSGSYTSGGVVEAGDLGLVDAVIQANAVPQGTTAITQSATTTPVTITGTIYVPAAQVSAYTSAKATALANFFATFPIGGLNTDNALNVLPIYDVGGVLTQAGIVAGTGASYVRGISGLALNGATVDLPIGATTVAVYTDNTTVVGQ